MLYFVPTPIGNLADISLRTLDVLKCCEIALCEDTRVCKSLFSLLNSKFNAQIPVKCFISLHSHNEKQVLSTLDKDFFEQNVAYLSDAGMPCISDPGVNLVRFAQKFDIKYEILPGANALLVAAAASGMIEKEFIFLGFLSNTGFARKIEIKNALKNEFPSIIYESPKRIKSLINDICECDEKREIFLIKEISKKFEKSWKNTAKNLREILANVDLKGEFVLVIAAGKKAKKDSISLSKNDIIALSLSTKEKAKLLAKFGEKSIKAWYDELSSKAKK